jgi:elongation factor G
MTIRHALLSIAVSPKTEVDRERLARGVAALTAEDPAMSAETDSATGEVVIAGMGELHLEIIIDRLKREFFVEASVGRPQVAYKERLTRAADGEGRYARHSMYAHTKVHLYPGEPGSGYVFENRIVGGAIPGQFIKSIDEGIQQALAIGVLAGYPVDDARVVLYDGSYHDTESSEMAFRIASSLALDDAARKAGAVLLEPVMQVEVVAPPEHLADVMEHLSSRRGQIQSREDRGSMHRIDARVPLAEMFGYAAINPRIRLRTPALKTRVWALPASRGRRFAFWASRCPNQSTTICGPFKRLRLRSTPDAPVRCADPRRQTSASRCRGTTLRRSRPPLR